MPTVPTSWCYFSAGANFWPILGHFWAIFAILGNFRSFLGHLLVLFFVAKYASVLFKSLFATLAMEVLYRRTRDGIEVLYT